MWDRYGQRHQGFETPTRRLARRWLPGWWQTQEKGRKRPGGHRRHSPRGHQTAPDLDPPGRVCWVCRGWSQGAWGPPTAERPLARSSSSGGWKLRGQGKQDGTRVVSRPQEGWPCYRTMICCNIADLPSSCFPKVQKSAKMRLEPVQILCSTTFAFQLG
jgi:hypothetical protein